MPQGKRGEERASMESLEDSSPPTEDESNIDPTSTALEEATVDSHDVAEWLGGIFGPDVEADFGGTAGIYSEPLDDRVGISPTGLQEMSSTGFCGSFGADDENAKETSDTAGLKTTGLEPETISGAANAAEAVYQGMQEGNSIGLGGSFEVDDTDTNDANEAFVTAGLEPEHIYGSGGRADGAVDMGLHLGRQLPASRRIPVDEVIRHLRKKKEFDGLTHSQLVRVIHQGLSHKKPILPSSDSTLETRVQGTEQVPNKSNRKGTGQPRGPYMEGQRDSFTITADGGASKTMSRKLSQKERLPQFQEKTLFVSKPHAGSEDYKEDSNTVESITMSRKESLPQFQEKIMFVSKPHAGSEDDKEDSNTVEKLEGERKVLPELSRAFFRIPRGLNDFLTHFFI
jgi:hypothetical protein